jgi:hypothetical protein
MNGARMTSLPASVALAGAVVMDGAAILAHGGDPGFVDGFHRAAALRTCDPAAFAALVLTPAALQPGAVFENTRVLHARTGFASGGTGTCRAATRISTASSRPWRWDNVRRTGDTRRKDRT